MDLLNIFITAWQSLSRNKPRTMLTILGIVIGVGSVIMLMSIGDGLKKNVSGQFDALGSNIIIVLPVNLFNEEGRPQPQLGAPPVGGKAFTNKEVRDIKRLDPSIQTAIPTINKRLKVKTASKQQVVEITASNGGYQSMRSITMAEGSFYSQADEDRSRKITVLGPTAAKNFFPNISPIGQTLTISSVPFKIIGITNARGAGGAFGNDMDNQLYIPLSSMQKLIDSNGIDTISVKAQDQQSVDRAVGVIKEYLGKQRKPDSFSVVDQRQLLGTAQSVIGVLTVGLSGIAAISLVVGGIGVMNMMLVTVTERTREIGLRKALGATPRVILLQFLIESVLLSLTGGVSGILIGAGGSAIVNQFFPTKVSLLAILLAFGVSTLVGVVFGILPARKAAKLSPINALRYE